MPIANSADVKWQGYLVSGLQGAGDVFIRHFQSCLTAKNLPSVTLKETVVNMWWQNYKCLDVISTLDGTTTCTIHVNPYGNNLFIGIAIAPSIENYYKAMAAACFITEVSASVIEATELTGKELNVEVRLEHVAR